MLRIAYRIKKLFFPTHITSKEFIDYLEYCGIRVGEGTHFFFPCSNTIDVQRPWLLRIGKYCKITEGVTILTHDYSRSVLRMKYGEVLAEAQKTEIGDNVFIGMKSIVLMGSKIGDNVIIGAGSLVKGIIPSNCVAAGVPAKVICSLEEYYQKRKASCLKESVEYVKAFVASYNRYPSINEMGAFFPLFLERSEEALKKHSIKTNLSGDDENDIIKCFLSSKPMFSSYEAFIEYIKKQ